MAREKWFRIRVAAFALMGFLSLVLPGIVVAESLVVDESLAADESKPGDESLIVAESETAPKGKAAAGSNPVPMDKAAKSKAEPKSKAAAAESSLAGVGEKLFSFGIRGTYFRPEGADYGRLYGGIQGRLHFHKAFALELSADYRKETYFNNPKAGAGQTIHVLPVQLSLLGYLMPGSRFSPFLLAGPGYYFTRIAAPGQNIQNRFGAHVGGGFQFFLNEYISLDATYRYVWTEAIQERQANQSLQSFSDDGSQVTFGINWHF